MATILRILRVAASQVQWSLIFGVGPEILVMVSGSHAAVSTELPCYLLIVFSIVRQFCQASIQLYRRDDVDKTVVETDLRRAHLYPRLAQVV
jgi:hypothetical protein